MTSQDAAEEASHNVYVVRLCDEALQERRFREENPRYVEGKPCAYVGITGLDPDERLENHKRGHKSSRIVEKYGQYLMRRQFERLNPMPYDEARRMEVELAGKLRGKGYAVWQR